MWPILDVLMRLVLAHLRSGRSTPDMIRLVQLAACGMGLPELLVIASGRAVTLQVVNPSREVLARSGSASALHLVDCERMRRLEILSEELGEGTLDVAQAETALDEADGPTWPWWLGPLGMTVLSVCVVMQVGADLLVVPLTAAVQLVVSLTGVLAARWQMPQVYAVALQALLGGLLATLMGLAHLVPLPVVAAAVAVPWMLIVPLPSLINIVIDAVEGAELAAASRLMFFVLTVAGLLLGAAGLIAVAGLIDLPEQSLSLPTLAIPLGLLFAVLGALANAIANGGGRPLLLPAASMGLLTSICNQLLLHAAGMDAFWASTLSAALLGAAAGIWSRRLAYPAAALALMGITGALLPGLTVYRGVLAQMLGRSGLEFYGQAALIVAGLGIGVAAGFHVAGRLAPRPRVSAALTPAQPGR